MAAKNSTGQITEVLVAELYRQYATDLNEVRSFQKDLYLNRGRPRIEVLLKRFLPPMRSDGRFLFAIRTLLRTLPGSKEWMYPAFDDIEAEVLYLLIRYFKPATTVEVSPAGGWSTSWVLQALRDNRWGHAYSCDVTDTSARLLPRGLTLNRWTFVRGDVRLTASQLPERFDCLLIDCLHTAEFAKWYIHYLFPRLTPGSLLAVNDIFTEENRRSAGSSRQSRKENESSVVLRWLRERNLNFFTAAAAYDREIPSRLNELRGNLGLTGRIHDAERNTTMFCLIPQCTDPDSTGV